MNLFENKYAAYKFNIASINYWKVKENRIRALKYLIEDDLKIPIEKVPLYITKMCLQRNARTLYNLLYFKKYYSNLFEWIEECYPSKFVKADFEINKYRDQYDSNDELVIDYILKDKQINAIYNSRKYENPICINGMYPDWIAPTENGCYIIEYFGLYVYRNENSMIDDYVKRTNEKLIKYKELENKGYKFIGLYPEDMKNDCQGVKEKIKLIS
jgi:hypothetical protein